MTKDCEPFGQFHESIGKPGFLRKKRKRHLQDIKVAPAAGCSKILLTKEDGAFFALTPAGADLYAFTVGVNSAN